MIDSRSISAKSAMERRSSEVRSREKRSSVKKSSEEGGFRTAEERRRATRLRFAADRAAPLQRTSLNMT